MTRDRMTPGDAYVAGYLDTTGEDAAPPCVEKVARGIFDALPGFTLWQGYAMGQESAREDLARDAMPTREPGGSR
jgi:hypothetical protein